jgi:glycerol-3-phosphate acyltransferase PlsX
LLGSIYAKSALQMENPRVALLNIGEEEGKGNAQAKATYDLMKEDKRYNFVGNVEASYIFTGKIGDVVVADAFVGNSLLKMAEALYRINFRLGGGKPRLKLWLRPILGRIIPKLYWQYDFWDSMNAESVGGLQVMGINAPVMIGHGSSSARAICSMILSMERDIKSNFPAKLREALKETQTNTEA